ncbi:flagellar assembly protein A [Clostridium sp.]|uniref:DUF342 domain-containing protein n=1 Tax=Clostridium sp. TaxID=1506 RepID=UPI00321661F8
MEESISTGTAKVVNGNIIITDGANNSEEPWIVKGKDIGLYVDGKEVKERVRVNSKSNIEVVLKEIKAERNLDITVSEDKMLATISISYSPEIIYTLEDTEEKKMIFLNSIVKEERALPKFTSNEILNELKSKGIIYGIDVKGLNSIIGMDQIKDFTIAKGKPPVEPIDDVLNIYFECGTRSFKADDHGNVNFKSIGNITSVKENEVLAKRIVGKEGTIGINLFSQQVQSRKKVVKDMMVKTGCKFLNKDTIVATIEGKPQLKGCVFQVNNVHAVVGDVDISTGDINFIGDVVINGDIKDGMKVKAGNSITVSGNAIRCNLWSEGDLNVKGSVISSDVKIKSEVSELNDYVETLDSISKVFKNVYIGVMAIKNSQGLKSGISDGKIVELVIKSKFFKFNAMVKKLLTMMSQVNDDNNEIFRILKIKYASRNYILISNAEELNTISKLIEEKVLSINSMKDIKANATIGYVQDSNIKCSGNVIIEGKGVYKSQIYAEDSIYFVTDGQCELRGGRIQAKNEIRTKIVGSSSGVTTELVVGKNGNIYCDIAYLNTKFVIGDAETILDENCRNVHVYIDKNKNLTVDKFKI